MTLGAFACGPREAEVTAEVEQRTGCAPLAVRLVDEAASQRVYEVDVRCPGGATRVERARWIRSGRGQRWTRLEVRTSPAGGP